MIFTHENSVRIMSGQKTQTRRLCKPGDTIYRCDGSQVVYRASGRERWKTGKAYAIQPGRGRPAVGQIVLTQITIDMNGAEGISEADAHAEGYASRESFLDAWAWINGIYTRTQPVFVLTFFEATHGRSDETYDHVGDSCRSIRHVCTNLRRGNS